MLFTAIALAATLQVATAGEIFKCQSAAGKIEYRDHPCDGASGEKIEAKDNSAGTGKDLTTIRAQDVAFNARLAAKQQAIDQANAANERQWRQDRAHRDSVVIEESIRDSYTPYYYPGYGYPYAGERPGKKDVARVVPAKKLEPPPSVPAKRKNPRPPESKAVQ